MGRDRRLGKRLLYDGQQPSYCREPMTQEEQLSLFGASEPAPAAEPIPAVPFDLIPTRADLPIPPGTYDDLTQLATHCRSCDRCGLSTHRTHVVVSRGNPKADILIVGEGPGQQEDETGQPFVGRSGQLLEQILASVNLNTQEDVYIANVVKCLTGDTLIATELGYRPLRWIVETRWAGRVLSVDDQRQLVWRSVTHWYTSPLAGRWLYRVSFVDQPHGYTATGDHPVLTRRGWIPVDELTAGDRVATGLPQRRPVLAGRGCDRPEGDFHDYLGQPTDWAPVKKELLTPQASDTPVYCIDVAETANFVTLAGVVHNCRPPGNRTPLPAEVEACRPYLLEQIRLVDPKIILFAGATAMKALTGMKKPITKIRGQWLDWNGRHCMALFHPAYLLRNPSKEKGKPKWLMWQDIQAIRQKYDTLRQGDG